MQAQKRLLSKVTLHRLARVARSCSLLAMILSVSGCAYRAGYGDREIPGGYHAVAVPVFKNNTHEAGVEVFFTNALIRELERSRIGAVTDKSHSQVTVEGVVDSIQYFGGSPTKAGTSVLNQTTKMVVTTTVRLRRNADQKVLWEGAFKKELNYSNPVVLIDELTSVNALYNHSAHYQNIEVLATDMMVEAHDRLTENF